MSTFNEHDALAWNPFEGDFGSPGDRTLKDKIVTARKGGECHNCGCDIQPKERIRTQSAIIDGSLMSWRWCQLCCEAMAKVWEDSGDAIEARYALKYSREDLTR